MAVGLSDVLCQGRRAPPPQCGEWGPQSMINLNGPRGHFQQRFFGDAGRGADCKLDRTADCFTTAVADKEMSCVPFSSPSSPALTMKSNSSVAVLKFLLLLLAIAQLILSVILYYKLEFLSATLFEPPFRLLSVIAIKALVSHYTDSVTKNVF